MTVNVPDTSWGGGGGLFVFLLAFCKVEQVNEKYVKD